MKTLITAGLLGLLLVIGVMSPGSAHDNSVYYPSFWQSNLSVHWKFEEVFPSTALRDRVKDGAQEWTSLSPVMNFVKDSGDYANFAFTSCPNTYQKNGVHWENIDGANGTWGSTRRCLIGINEIFTTQIRFDSSESWYTGTSTSVPSTQYDAWGAAAHEFGHATGFSGPYANGHFDPNAAICSGVIHTMCPTMGKGTWTRRTLEEHDVHTFTNQYP